MRYRYYIHKDFGGIPAGDKEAVMEQLYHGPKTTREMAGISMPASHTLSSALYSQ